MYEIYIAPRRRPVYDSAMPTTLPPRPAPPLFDRCLLAAVAFIAWLAAVVAVRTLIWRFRLSSAIKNVSFVVFRFAVSLSDRSPTTGLWLIRLATMIVRVANAIKPNRRGPFLRRTLHRRSVGEE
jgi:hypothetical protein